MSLDSEKSCIFLSHPDSRSSCVWEAADEKEEDLGVGEESVLEMLTYSKFSDLETWLCLPSSQLLPKTLDSASNSSTSSTSCSSSSSSSSRSGLSFRTDTGETVPKLRSSKKDSCLRPPFTSTPKAASVVDSTHSVIRRRQQLTGGPGGLHWDTAGSLQRDFRSPVLSQVTNKAAPGGLVRPLPLALRGGASWDSKRATLRKTVSVDERLIQVVEGRDDLRLLSLLERDRKKLCGVQGLSTSRKHNNRKKSEGPVYRSAQRWNQKPSGNDLKPLLDPRTSKHLLPVLTRHMQNLQLSQNKKWPIGPASPSAAKRLYRNLTEKLRGSATSFEDASFSGRMDHLRKGSSMQCGGCLLEAVEQQDLDSVQILLLQFSGDELDLNTPNSPLGLMPLDIAVMTNNIPITRLLLRAGAKESPQFVDVASRDAHLSALVLEAEQRATHLVAAAQRDGLSLDECQKDQHLRAWEWRCKLYRCMRAGLQNARAPEAPSLVRLTVSSSSTLTVTFQEPQGLNATVVTKYRVEWSCLKDFSLLAGEMVLDNLQTLKCIISNLTTGRLYYVRVSAYNMKGWGSPTLSLPPSAAPSSWREGGGRDSRSRGYIEAMERLLQQVRATHTNDCCGDSVKIHNASRKQSVSRSLKLLFNSSNKFIKVLKRGLYLAAVLYHQDRVLVSAEDQIPIVEVDDSFSNSLMQDFLWFTKLSCMWDDVRWLRQTSSLSMMSSSSTLQLRHKMLTATHQLQNLLGTQNLGRVHYEPIKDRHGNVLLVTVRDIETLNSVISGKWIQVSKLQSQRKSLSTPEEPYALDFLIITIQDILAYQRRSTHRLAPGLYLGYLKLSSSVDQIKVLVSLRTPNMLCHARIRDNANVSREEWDWLQKLSVAGGVGEAVPEGHAPVLFYELQMAIKSLLRQINVPVHQARRFRLYSHEVIELGHGVNFLLLLPAADDVCSAPGGSNPYTSLSGFLQLPLQMFELGHFCAYKERFMGLYCRLSSVLDLDALITQQALREAITDGEVATAKQRHQLILDYIQQLDEMRRDIRWITDVLQNARKGPHGGIPITFWVEANDAERISAQQKTDSTSSTMDFLTTLSPSPEPNRWNSISDSVLGSDEDASSEVFLPTDSDYDSRDALSPQVSDLLYSSSLDLSEQAAHSLGGSAPDVLQIHQLRCSSSPFKDPLLSPVGKDSPSSPKLPHYPAPSKDWPRPLSISTTLPTPTPLSGATKTLEGLSLSKNSQEGCPATPTNAPAKRKLRSRSHQYFSGPNRWLRGHNGENLSGSLSEGVYTRQLDPDLPSVQGMSTYVSHTSCVLESRRGRHREPRTHVRRIFVEPCKELSPGQERKSWEEVKAARVSVLVESGGEEPDRACTHEVDSDDQTNAQVSEILSSTL